MKISHKLIILGVSVIGAFGAVTIFAHLLLKQSITSSNALATKTGQLLLIGDVSRNVNNILLTSMDILVDKAEGRVDDTRQAVISESAREVRRDLAVLKNQTGDAQYDQMMSQFDMLVDTVQQDLYTAIAGQADIQELSRIDDAVDAGGSALLAMAAQIRTVYKERFVESEDMFEDMLASSLKQNWELFAGVTVIYMLVMGFMVRSINRSVRGISEDIARIASGDAESAVTSLGKRDEIGQIAVHVENLRVQAEEAFRLKQMVDDMPTNIITADPHNEFKINYANKSTVDTLAKMEHLLPIKASQLNGQSIDIFHKDPGRIRTILMDPRNLPHQAKIKLGSEILDLRVSAMRNKRGEYVGTLLSWTIATQNAQLADTFESSVGSVSEQIAGSANSLQQAAVSLQGAIEELSATARDISSRTHESLKVVQDAAAKGESARSFMQNLTNTSEKVSGVVTLIRSIAEKTNLLALNASIESARAGDAGKGFAVVANEVKSLATQTANAITEISKQVTEMQESANGTHAVVQEMCDILDAVNQIATNISATVEEQQASTSEIARSVGDAGSASSSSTSVIAMATQLQAVSYQLRTECNEFVAKVRKM